MTRRVLVPTLLLLAAIAVAQPAGGKKFALAVGINEYNDKRLTTLQFAENDASELAAALAKHGFEVVLMTGAEGKKDVARKPTRANILATLKKLLAGRTKDDTLLVGFAGHGVQFANVRNKAFFCPIDAVPDEGATNSLVSVSEIYDQFKASSVGAKLMLVDACRDDPSASRGVTAQNVPRPPNGVGVLFSCSAGQRAYEHPDYKHGVFFHHVLEGLAGPARDTEGFVTWETLSSHVRRKVATDVPQRFNGARQEPHGYNDLEGSSPVLAKLPKGKAGKVRDKDKARSVGDVKPPVSKRPEPKGPKTITLDLGKGVTLDAERVPAGEFLMGSPAAEKGRIPADEGQQKVTISQQFYMGRTEVTVGQFRRFVEEKGYVTLAEKRRGSHALKADGSAHVERKNVVWKSPGFPQDDTHPVTCVAWADANEFCKWLAAKSGKTVQLPTDAEWEYACRADTTTAYVCGDDPQALTAHANLPDATIKKVFPDWFTLDGNDGYAYTAPVGKYKPNKFGLYDMHGNVREWVRDAPVILTAAASDPVGPPDEKDKGLRGGAWGAPPSQARGAFRAVQDATYRDTMTGFRVWVR